MPNDIGYEQFNPQPLQEEHELRTTPTLRVLSLLFTMPAPRQELLRLLAHKSFKLGDFRLSSGGTSDYYIDCRTTTLDARGSQPARFS